MWSKSSKILRQEISEFAFRCVGGDSCETSAMCHSVEMQKEWASEWKKKVESTDNVLWIKSACFVKCSWKSGGCVFFSLSRVSSSGQSVLNKNSKLWEKRMKKKLQKNKGKKNLSIYKMCYIESGDFATKLHVYRWCAYLKSILKLRNIHKDNGGVVDNEIKDVFFSSSSVYIKVEMTSPRVMVVNAKERVYIVDGLKIILCVCVYEKERPPKVKVDCVWGIFFFNVLFLFCKGKTCTWKLSVKRFLLSVYKTGLRVLNSGVKWWKLMKKKKCRHKFTPVALNKNMCFVMCKKCYVCAWKMCVEQTSKRRPKWKLLYRCRDLICLGKLLFV